MSQLTFVEQSSKPTTPAAGEVNIFMDNTATPRLTLQDDTGTTYLASPATNVSVSTVSAGYASDTYLAGSSITIKEAGAWRVGQIYRCKFDMVKTAAGSATPIITVRMGTLGTTGDASIATITWAAGTAAADTAMIEILISFRTVGGGTSAVVQVIGTAYKQLTTTGFTNTTTNIATILSTSGGFNSTTQTIIGLSFNGGASFSGTNTLVQAELIG